MKTRFFLVSMLFLFVTALQAQNNNGDNRSGNRPNGVQREFPSKEMIKEYALTQDQVTKLKKVSADYTKKREALNKEMREAREKNKENKEAARPNEESMKKMKNLMDEQNKAIKEVLTKEQQEKWDKQQAERAEKMKNAQNNRQRGDRPNVGGERGNRNARPNQGAPNRGLW